MHKKKNPFVSSDAKYLLFMPILILAVVILLVGILFQISKQSYAQVTYWTDSGNYSTEFGGTDADGSFYKPYLISTPEQLAGLAYFTNTGELKEKTSQSAYKDGLYFKLTNNINLTKIDSGGNAIMWKPIGTFEYPFSGHFDGCGYSISGMQIKNFNTKDEPQPQGLFGYVYVDKELNTSFENLKIEGAISTQNQLKEYPDDTDKSKVNGIGGLVGNLSGIYNATFTNISSNVYISAEYAYNVGGVVGISHGGIFKQCQNNGTVSGQTSVGGLVGKACSIISYYRTSSNKVKTLVSITVGNCSNNGTVSKQEHGTAIGGIIGWIDSGYVKAHNEDNKSFTDDYESAQVSNSYNNGRLNCKNSTCVGGIVGWITSSLKNAIINNCFNSGLVQGQTNTAGIVGSVESREDAKHNLSNNSNFGQCEAITAVGGIAGCINNTVIIGGCYNNAKIAATQSGSGGIVGRMTMSDNSTANVSVGYCYNQGQVLSVEKIGGIIGEINYTANSSSKNTINLETCLNNGVVGGDFYVNPCKYYAGGIVGFIDCTTPWLSITIKNCANKSQVKSFLVAGGIVGYYSSSGTNTVINCLNDRLQDKVVVGMCSKSGGAVLNQPPDEIAAEIAKILGSGLYYGGIIGYNADSKGANVSNCLNKYSFTLPSSGDWVKTKSPNIISQYVGQIIGRNVKDNNKTGTNYCINPTVKAYGNDGGKPEEKGIVILGTKEYRFFYGVDSSSGASAVYKADTEYTDSYINNNIVDTNKLPKNMRTISDWQTEANRLKEVWANGNVDINNGLPYFKDWYW